MGQEFKSNKLTFVGLGYNRMKSDLASAGQHKADHKKEFSEGITHAVVPGASYKCSHPCPMVPTGQDAPDSKPDSNPGINGRLPFPHAMDKARRRSFPTKKIPPDLPKASRIESGGV